VALCGSGVGASIAANKVPGVRAGLIHDVFSAHQGAEDDDMNVWCSEVSPRPASTSMFWPLGSRMKGARGFVKSWEELMACIASQSKALQ
jgi:hypothetical protein